RSRRTLGVDFRPGGIMFDARIVQQRIDFTTAQLTKQKMPFEYPALFLIGRSDHDSPPHICPTRATGLVRGPVVSPGAGRYADDPLSRPSCLARQLIADHDTRLANNRPMLFPILTNRNHSASHAGSAGHKPDRAIGGPTSMGRAVALCGS